MSLGKFKIRKFVFGQLQKFWAIRECNNIYNLKEFGKQILLRKKMLGDHIGISAIAIDSSM